MVDITAVVVTHNRASSLDRALESLINQVTEEKFGFEILVIDDGSTDNTAEVVANFINQAGPVPVRYVFKRNGGEGDARNKGVDQARGNWIAFLDDDERAEPEWLRELFRVALEQQADIVDGSVALELPAHVWHELGPRARMALGEKILETRKKPYCPKDDMGAGNVLIRKSLFRRLGGFDVSFRQGVDTDFFWRAAQAGCAMRHAPRALIHHVIPPDRLEVCYFRELCLRIGAASARIHHKYNPPHKVLLSVLWRLGVALGRDGPLFLLAAIANKKSLLLDSSCGWWYSMSFIRSSLAFFAPKLLRQPGVANF